MRMRMGVYRCFGRCFSHTYKWSKLFSLSTTQSSRSTTNKPRALSLSFCLLLGRLAPLALRPRGGVHVVPLCRGGVQNSIWLRLLALLDQHNSRFYFSLRCIEPFIVEPMRIDLNSNQPIFGPSHKLGQVEWEFVEAQCKKQEGLSFIQRSTQSMYATATVVVRKKTSRAIEQTFSSVGTTGHSTRKRR